MKKKSQEKIKSDLLLNDNFNKISESKQPLYYVAVGASAGGLEAIDILFSKMPIDTGFAFIIIQHLSPDYKSLMVELLSKKTKMPVHRAEDNMQVLANNIYLIPPKKNLSIFHGKLFLTEQDHSKGINLPIDYFFKSLAEDQGEKAICIILSGTGSDGARGLRAIKENGGMVMVQKEDTAKFDGMPRAAIATGLVDFIIPPEEMPQQLLNFVKHPFTSKIERPEAALSGEEGLTKIFSILREKFKVDFTFYKPNTITRRIERRMAINQIDNIQDYVNYLLNYPGEVASLYRELLIGVTSFFRDQDAFEVLKNKWLPEMLESLSGKDIRFWVAGCSTGEEAYSLAIIFKELEDSMNLSFNLKIFATDIDKDALYFAAQGTYPESIAADVSIKYLAKYFYKREDSYQIVRNVREMVVFAEHNLIKDPPFTNINLISCRNLMIYLQPILQQKVLDYFNFSLVPSGLLFLGTSESILDKNEYFEILDQKFKIFRSKGRHKPYLETSNFITATDTRSKDLLKHYTGVRRQIKSLEEERILERFLNTISNEYLPPSLIVNEYLEVQHSFGNVQDYFKIPTGKLVNDIKKMAIKELYIPISTGIQKVFRERKELRFSNIKLQVNNEEKVIDLVFKPLIEKKGQDSFVLIFIYEVKQSKTSNSETSVQSFNLSKESEERMKELEIELQYTKENLQATIEELETSNEELQATNEELLASNEELQSTNEELQSTNEELFTVNAEYQSKILELTELHNDIDNLLEASLISQLILDENLEIRKFSPQITNIFTILKNDIGRPINHISHNIVNLDPYQIIYDVQKISEPIEREIITKNGDWFLMRVSPYKISPKSFSGVVVSFVNINQLKKSQKDLNLAEEKFKNLFETMELGVVYQNTNGEIILANPAAEKILGLSLEQMLGKKSVDASWRAIHEDGTPFYGDEHPSMIALKTGKKVKDVIMGVFNPVKNNYVWINISAIPLIDESTAKPYLAYAIFEDVTLKREYDHLMKTSEEQYRILFSEIRSGISLNKMIYDENNNPINFRILKVNKIFEQITGIKTEIAINSLAKELIPEIDNQWNYKFDSVLKSGEPLEFQVTLASLKKTLKIKAYKIADDRFAAIFDEV